jgi:hypothetical protein
MKRSATALAAGASRATVSSAPHVAEAITAARAGKSQPVLVRLPAIGPATATVASGREIQLP